MAPGGPVGHASLPHGMLVRRVLLSRPAAWVYGWLPTQLKSFQLELFLAPQVYSSTQPLRIGYYETDFFTMPSPAMRRAVRETKKLLEDAGHTVGCCTNPTVMLNLCFPGTMCIYPWPGQETHCVGCCTNQVLRLSPREAFSRGLTVLV